MCGLVCERVLSEVDVFDRSNKSGQQNNTQNESGTPTPLRVQLSYAVQLTVLFLFKIMEAVL